MYNRMTCLALFLAVLPGAGCNNEPRDDDANLTGNDSTGEDPTTTTPATDTGGTTVVEGSSSSDGPDPDSGSSDEGSTTEAGCVPDEAPATTIARPADVLVLFDNSDSMMEEAALVAAQLGDFVTAIDASVVPQVALLSEYPAGGPAGLCIEPPLGGGGCPTDDDNLPAYTHVDVTLSGTTALAELVAQAAGWDPITRENSVAHIVVISDDDTNNQVNEFEPMISPLVDEYVVHVSVPAEDPDDACMGGGACCMIAQEDAPDYREHGEASGGVVHDMCGQDFDTFFADVADVILARSPDKCRWEFPAGADPTLLNLQLDIDGGAGLLLPYSPSVDECIPAASGWYYDDPAAPTLIELCPTVCNSLGPAMSVVAILQTGCPTLEQ